MQNSYRIFLKNHMNILDFLMLQIQNSNFKSVSYVNIFIFYVQLVDDGNKMKTLNETLTLLRYLLPQLY